MLIVVASLSLVLVWKAGDLLAWTLVGFEERIAERLPEDLAEADAVRLANAFDDARAAIAAGRIDPAGLQALQRTLLKLSRGQATLTRGEVDELSAALEGVVGAAGGARNSTALVSPQPS